MRKLCANEMLLPIVSFMISATEWKNFNIQDEI